ncbi:VanZ family protein [Pseudocnuella soli]|uniref:VanZ family protein n=1 Tax=Pseudocnuella soli TaxID=2502779 RepID=UPI0010446D9F|nr:VanZ family protein [Pseudocnuella soli]
MQDLKMVISKAAKARAWVLFIFYLFLLSWFLFVSVGGTVRDEYFDKRIVHWVPMKHTYQTLSIIISGNFGAENKVGYTYLAFRNIIGNILLFMPFGFLAPIVLPFVRSLKAIVLFTAAFSLTAEMIQFVLKIGVFDIDDVIFNLIGGTLGYLCLYGFRNLLFRNHLSKDLNREAF